MNGWQIDPGAVGRVLTDVYDQATSTDGLAGAVTSEAAGAAVDGTWVAGDRLYGPGVSGRGGPGAMYVGAVPVALSKLLTGVFEDMGKVGSRVVAGVMGVTAATLSYQRGQEDMCAASEQAMAAAASSWDSTSGRGDYSWFEANGFMGTEGQA